MLDNTYFRTGREGHSTEALNSVYINYWLHKFHTFMLLWRTSPPQYVQATALFTQSFSLWRLRCLLSMLSSQAAHCVSPYWQLSSCAYGNKSIKFLKNCTSNDFFCIKKLWNLWVIKVGFFDALFDKRSWTFNHAEDMSLQNLLRSCSSIGHALLRSVAWLFY